MSVRSVMRRYTGRRVLASAVAGVVLSGMGHGGQSGGVGGGVAWGTPTVQSLSDSHGNYYLVNNGVITFQTYTSGALAGKVTSIKYKNQEMVGTKGLYYDIQGSPNIYYGTSSTFAAPVTGSDYVILSMKNPAGTQAPIDTTLYWIIRDNEPGFSTYQSYHHTAAMADWGSTENRFAEFFNESIFNYSSISDKYWGYQAAGDANRGQGRYITAETSDMRGIPSEYIKNYETKYDWRTTYKDSGGQFVGTVTGLFTSPNTSLATRAATPMASNFGVWDITNSRSVEGWNAGPTHPQSPWADGASFIITPAASHQGGPSMTFTGNMDKAYGPHYTYFNTGSDITSLRSDANAVASGSSTLGAGLNAFYDSISSKLENYVPTSGRGAVTGVVRTGDGLSMEGATIVLSTFDPAGYAADPIGQEYQRRANGYNYWVTPAKDGTFSLSDVRPGTYRVTVVKPGLYREGTFDNIVVSAGGTTNVGRLTWTPDINGTGVFQIGKFDRKSSEFRDGQNFNNWIDTYDHNKQFPNGVNYTVNPANPTNDPDNWSQNWGLYQMNAETDFWKVNFNLASAPVTGSTVTLTFALASQEFINSVGVQVGGNAYNYSGFDHTADNSSVVYRSGDTSSRVMYRKLTLPTSQFVAGNNTLTFHIVGGEMQWDALRLDIQNPGTWSQSQWNGGTGNWTDGTQWLTQKSNYTAVLKGTASNVYSTSTTFADGASATAPVNSAATTNYYDATLNGGTVTLNTSVGVQKLSLLAGTISAGAGTPTLTANDAVVLGGGTLTGKARLNALSTTTVTFDNTISAGFTVTSTGTVTVVDGSSVTVTGAGSRWDTTGVSLGSGSSLSVGAGGTFNAGTGTLNLSSGATASSVVGGAVVAGSVVSAGSLNLAGTLVLGTGGALTNSGTAVISGVISGSAQVVNTRGLLVLSGTNSYLSGTTITGGTVQFASLVAIGGSGANVTVGYGGAVAFGGGVTNAGFLARLAPGAKGALALLPGDSATNLDFTSGALASVNQMSVGAAAGSTVTFTGTITPAGGTYRLGGGGGAIVLGNPISGSASLVVGNTGSDGVVRLPGASNYAGTTTVRGGSLQLTVLAAGGLPSSLGASSNAASNLVLDGGTVSYVGSGSQSTDRLMTVRGSVAFDSSGSGSASWSNTGAVNMLWPGNRTVLLGGTSTGSNVFAPTLADPLVGATSLTKTGTGTWTLGSGTSTYSGDTAILGGTLKLGGSANLPSGAGKGNLSVGTSATLDLSGSAASINGLNDGPAPASGWASPNGPGGGTITNSGPSLRTLTIGNGDAGGLYSGIIAGNVSLVKTGAGTQILSGDNSYLGTTTISGGTLQVGVGGTPSSTGPGDGGFRGMLGAGAVINNATLTFNRGYYTTVSNVISGTGTLKQVANAQLVLAGLNTYTGPTVIGGGIANIGLGGPTDYTGLAYSGDSSINASVLANGGVASSIGASSNAASNLVLNGGTLFYSSTSAVSTDRLFTVTAAGGAIYTSGALTFTNTGALGMTGTGDRVLSLGGDSTSASTVSAAISDPAGGGKTGLTKDRSATWILTSPSHSYSGDTTLLMGTLKIGTGGKLPFGPGKGNIVFGTSTDFSSVYPAILDLNGNDLSVNAISGGNLGTGYWSVTNSGASLKTLTLGNGDATGDFNGDIEGNINVVKTGLGTQTLDGTNSYAGSTTINGGALILGPTATIGGTGRSITIASGATLGVPASVMSQSFLGRIATNGATGTLALTSSETNSLDFSATGANLSAISLGAGVGTNVTMSGLITPFGAMYRLGGGGGALTVSSNLTGASSSVVVSGAGTVVLSGTNTYGGPVTVGSGSTLQFGTTASLAGGTGANITVSAGGCVAVGYALDLAFLGRVASTSAGVVALGANSANNLSFATPGLANVSLGATAAVTYSGLLTPSGTTYRLGGGGGTLTVSAVNALTGANSLVVSGPGTVVVSAANNFTGTVTINSGATLQASVANGGTASGLGISSNAASNLVLAGGTLRVVGSTDRSFTLSSNSTLDCGSGTTGIGFGSSTGVVSMPASANLTLTLTGSNSGHNTLSLQLPNPSGGTLSIIKTGTGKWTFSGGAKTYSGTTQVLAGQLETLATNALSANSNLFIDSGASLEMHDFSQTILSLSGSGNIYNTFSTNKTLTLGGTNGSGTYTGIITAPITVTKTGTGTQYFGGNNTYAQTTTISGGILGLGIPGSNSTSGSLGTGPVVNNARLALYRSDNYTLPNNISGSGVLEQAGSGQTTLTGSITYTGNTSVTGSGSLIFASVFKPVTSSLVVSGVGGDAIFNGTGVAAQFAGITVAAGGTVALGLSDRPTVSPRVLVTNSLSIAAGGTLDLGNGDMIIKGGASNLAALRSYVASGALIASASQTNSPEYTPYTTLAIFANDASGQPYFTSYDGVTGLANTDVIVKYTYLGDTNLDGVLDGKDYRRIMEGAITGQTGWNWGDLDYSGGPVSTADLTEFLAVYDWYQAQSSVTNLGNGQDGGSAVVAIPEPGRSLPAAAILTTLLTRGRRRRR